MEHEHIAPAGSPDSIILLGPRREVLAWNDAAERLYGWSSTEMMGALAHDRLCCTIPAHPELTPLSVPVHFRGVFRRLARDGSLKAVEVLRMPYGAFGAAPRGVLEFGRDITRRPDPHPGAADDVPCAAPAPPPTPRIELDVRALADTLRAWRDQGADIHRVMSTNAALVRALLATVRVIAVNAGAARLFGSVDGRLLPDELDAIWPVESLPTLAASVLAATEGAGESSAGCTLHTLTGRRFSALLTASRLHGAPDGCVAVGIIDVSSRAGAAARAAVKGTAHARATQAHAGRIAMLGGLAVVLAHEVSQPLSAIALDSQTAIRLLDRPVPDIDELRVVAERASAQAARASEILTRIKRMAAGHAAVHAPVGINALLTDAVAVVAGEAQRLGATVCLEPAGNLPELSGDHVELEQVVVNLVMNAVQAMSATTGARRVRLATMLDGNAVRLVVDDTGPGIAPLQRSRLFEPFFTTKPRGLGVGLSLCRSIVEAHGGSIALESPPDGWATRFAVLLPVSAV